MDKRLPQTSAKYSSGCLCIHLSPLNGFWLVGCFLGSGGDGAGSQYVAQTGLQLAILLPQPPECWDYRRAPPRPAPAGIASSSLFFFTTF
jgi:hypothetical protein